MQTALDVPTDGFNEYEKNLVSNIREHGWFRTSVEGDNEHPAFTYTTGFWISLNHPELIIFSLNSDTTHNILWDIYRNIKAGREFPICQPITNIFAGFEAVMVPVAKKFYGTYLLSARWFYGNEDFPCHQLIWPDPTGLFPWQPGADLRFVHDQPDLSSTGWNDMNS